MKRLAEDSQVLVMDDQEVVCSWHQTGKDPEGTHGICQPCAEQIYGEWQMSKVPSYVERFKDERKR